LILASNHLDIIGHWGVWDWLDRTAVGGRCCLAWSSLKVISHFCIEFFRSLLGACTWSLATSSLCWATTRLASSTLLLLGLGGWLWLRSILGLTVEIISTGL